MKSENVRDKTTKQKKIIFERTKTFFWILNAISATERSGKRERKTFRRKEHLRRQHPLFSLFIHIYNEHNQQWNRKRRWYCFAIFNKDNFKTSTRMLLLVNLKIFCFSSLNFIFVNYFDNLCISWGKQSRCCSVRCQQNWLHQNRFLLILLPFTDAFWWFCGINVSVFLSIFNVGCSFASKFCSF